MIIINLKYLLLRYKSFNTLKEMFNQRKIKYITVQPSENKSRVVLSRWGELFRRFYYL